MSGTDRKIHVQVQLTARSRGFREMRINASTVPSRNPATTPNTVNSSVSATASRIGFRMTNRVNVGQSNAVLVTSAWPAIATRTATPAGSALENHSRVTGTASTSMCGVYPVAR